MQAYMQLDKLRRVLKHVGASSSGRLPAGTARWQLPARLPPARSAGPAPGTRTLRRAVAARWARCTGRPRAPAAARSTPAPAQQSPCSPACSQGLGPACVRAAALTVLSSITQVQAPRRLGGDIGLPAPRAVNCNVLDAMCHRAGPGPLLLSRYVTTEPGQASPRREHVHCQRWETITVRGAEVEDCGSVGDERNACLGRGAA